MSPVSQDVSLSLRIEPVVGRPPVVSLFDWVQRDPDYRGSLRPVPAEPAPGTLGGAQILAGVLAPGTALGLFRLLRAWLDLQRAKAKVHVVVGGVEIDVELDGKFDPATVTAELLSRVLGDDAGR